jgi:two-component system sensor histidine kinase DesK
MRTSSPEATARDPNAAAPTATLRAAMAAEPGDASQRAWRRLNFAALAVFLPIYWKSFLFEGRMGLLAALAMAATGFALTPWNSGGNTLLVYAFASLGFSQRWRIAAGVAVALLAAYAGWLWVLSMPMPFIVAPGLIGGAVLAGAILAKREMQRNERLRLTQAEVDRLARVAERERIARDLHDLLGHTLSVIALKSELARKLAERDGSAAATHIGEVEQVARDALKQVREAVTGMRSAEIANELVNARLAAVGAGLGFDAQVDPLPPLDAAQENALAMGLREAITNVLRHARAGQVQVRLLRQGRAVQLDVQDDGAGIVGTPGNGLAGMRERVEALGGQLTLDSAAGAGTRLRLLLPLDGADARR